MASLNAASDIKAQILQATDIVEVIGQSVALKRKGKDFVGLCPFHQDKNPSFHVSPSKQMYKCFACGEGGDVFKFVMKRDRVEFVDAMRILAERAGVEFNRTPASKEKASERMQMYDAHSAACAFFENLLSHEVLGKAAREYLTKRGFTLKTIKDFRIGLAADAWDALLRSPGMKKFPPGLLALAGLVKPRQGGDGHYDTFRNRVMFPIFEEAQGRIIAFGGRVVPPSEDTPKYLNSPETPLFSKSRSIYGLNFARQKMLETETAIIVEGYTDVVMCHQYGVSNVVSVLGTAMTEQHVNTLKRFAKKIVLLFDADAAGDKAVDRAVEHFLTKDVEIAIASMPDGVDPDEYVMQHGAEGFEKMIAAGRDVLSFKWSQMDRQFRGSIDVTGQQKAVETYLQLLADARGGGTVDVMRWGSVLARVSRLTEIPIDDLHRRFTRKSTPKPTIAPASNDSSEPASKDTNVSILPVREVAERRVLGMLLKEPQRWQKIKADVHPEDFVHESRRILAEIFWHHQQDMGEPVFAEFLADLPGDTLKTLAVELLEEMENVAEPEESFRGALDYFKEERQTDVTRKQLAEIRRSKEEQASPEEAAARFAEFVKNNQASNPRRLGPVRRFKSGS